MGSIHTPPPVKIFVGVLYSVPALLPRIENRLSALLGPIDVRSETFPFDSTHYYDDEMGTPIHRCFFSFSQLSAAESIVRIKTSTNELEAAIAREHVGARRPVNLDPGYVELAKIVLASTKNFYHRILISGGIYAEVTQRYEAGEWRSFPWTFPDFRSGRYNTFFSTLRALYHDQIK